MNDGTRKTRPDDAKSQSTDTGVVDSVTRPQTAVGTEGSTLRAVGEIAPIGIFVSDAHGRPVYLNGIVLDILDQPSDTVAEHWFEAIHPDDRDRVLDEWSECKLTGRIFRSRHRFVQSNGEIVRTDVIATPMFDASGDFNGMVGTMQDVTGEVHRAGERADLLEQQELMLARMPIGCILADTDFRWTYWNPAAEVMFGYTHAEVRGQSSFDVITTEAEKPDLQAAFSRIADGEAIVEIVGSNVTKDGRTIVCSWKHSALRKVDGTFLGTMSMCQDITQQVESEHALRRSEQKYRQMLDTAQEGVWLRDANARTVFVNRRMSDMLGYNAEEMMGRPVYDFMDADARAEAEHRFARRMNGECQQHDVRYKHKNGSDIWTIVSASPIYDDNGEFAGVFGMITDITERKRQEETVWLQAYHDALTGLPNRALFEDRLAQLLIMSERQDVQLAIMFIDLDRFKHVNDTLGHDVGDQLLKIVADRIAGCLRAGDTVARMGGDEFTALLPGIQHAEDAIKVAQKVIEALALPIQVAGQELYAPGSIGISLHPTDGPDVQSLLKHADIAMYRAKEQGGGYCMYSESMNKNALEHLVLESSLRRALARDEFHLVYQPLVNVERGDVTAVEALCRWTHPEFGIVHPAQFIPLAEETGMIVPLGEWVLREACRQAARWRAAGHPRRVSVNISARQFAQPGLADIVASALIETGLDSRWLDLELTEGAIVQNPQSAAEILRGLRTLGVRLALDDFGTGFSSLAHLRQFKFDLLKIDRSFVTNLVEDKVTQAIVRAIIDMAHSLDLEVVAEGVETREQLNALMAMGCTTVQGYLFSRPVTADRIIDRHAVLSAA